MIFGLDTELFTGAVIGITGTVHFMLAALVLYAQLHVPPPERMERRVVMIWFLPIVGPVAGLMCLAAESGAHHQRPTADNAANRNREMDEVDWVRAAERFAEDLRRRGVR